MKLRSKILILILFLSFPALLNAQYSANDKSLVKTTFQRSFNKKVISNYLISRNNSKINAALLSIAQSSDTSFIHQIIKLNFNSNAEYICFALGQLGENKNSSEYLFSKLNDANTPDSCKSYIIKAIGKTGSLKNFNNLVADYDESKGSNFNGISIAIFDFFNRKIISNEQAENILGYELSFQSLNRRIDAAFAISRLGLSEKLKDIIYNYFINDYSNYYKNNRQLVFVQFLIENLKRAKYAPFSFKIFTKLLYLTNPLLKTEAASLLVYYPFKANVELDAFLRLISDNNPNVSRQAAISLNQIIIPDDLKLYAKEKIAGLINDTRLPANTRGELFLSYGKLFNVNFEDLVNKFADKINPEFIYRAASSNTKSEFAFNFIIRKIGTANGKEKIDAFSALLEFKSFSHTDRYKNIIFSSLNSKSPVLTALAVSGIDSVFIAAHSDDLKKSLIPIIKNFKNDPAFYETNQAIAELSGRIDASFERVILKELSNSKIYPLKKFAAVKLGIKYKGSDLNSDLFNQLWKNSFNFRSATINTSKGSFTIEFTPEFAPVSVGNFCALALKNYFNGTIFHRVVPAFVVQGGDPTGTGWGGPEYNTVSEFSPLHYSISAVGMASSGKDTEGSQWFVTLGDYPHLDGRYSIFGYVTNGMDVVYLIDQNDEIISVDLNH